MDVYTNKWQHSYKAGSPAMINFSDVTDIKINGQMARYLVADIKRSGSIYKRLIWRKPREYPYTTVGFTSHRGEELDDYEFICSNIVDKYGEPTYSNTVNFNFMTGAMTSEWINVCGFGTLAPKLKVGDTFTAYYCQNETDCKNLADPALRKNLLNAEWFFSDQVDKKIFVYAAKNQSRPMSFIVFRYGADTGIEIGVHYEPTATYEEYETLRTIEASSPLITLNKTKGSKVTVTDIRDDYSEYVAKYEEITSGQYPKSEYPYLNGFTLLTVKNKTLGIDYGDAFHIFFQVDR